MSYTSRLAALAAAALCLTGCVSASTRRERAARKAAESIAIDTTIVVQVHSDYAEPVKVWFVKNKIETLLGEVAASRDTLFYLAPSAVGREGLALLAVPRTAHERATTRVVQARAGQVVRFDVARDLARSLVTVRWGARCWTCPDPFKSP